MDFRLPGKYAALVALGVNMAAVTTNETDRLALIQLGSSAMGPSLSTLLIRYAGASVVQAFFIIAASFGARSPWGYTAHRAGGLRPLGLTETARSGRF